MDKFTEAYIEAALWSSTNEGEPLDSNYSIRDIHPDTIKKMDGDCQSFIESQYDNLELIGATDEQNGYDFWLTRNGHGAGFWDRGYKDDEETKCAPCDYYKNHPVAFAVKNLVDSCHAYGSFDLYIGDDGMIHGH